MKNIIKALLIIILAGAVIYGGIYFAKKATKTPEVYETKNPSRDNIIKKTVATGSVVPRQEIEIKPQVNGILEEIYIEPGEFVQKGDLIAKVIIIPDMFQLNEAETRMNKAKLNFEDSKLIYDRQKKLFEQEIIPEAEFQKYRLEFYNAREEFEAAENYLQLTREGVTKKAAKVSNTLVKSTITGMVLDVPVEEGKSVIMANQFNEGTTIATVADMGEMIFKGKIDETEVGKLKEGMPIKVTVGAIDDQEFDANLEYIAPKGVEENGAIQFEIRAEMKLKKDFFIRAGYSANAEIVLDRRDSVIVIPESFVKFERESDSAYVEVESDVEQVFEKRFIKTGLSDGLNIEIVEGITLENKIKTNRKLSKEEIAKIEEDMKKNKEKEERDEKSEDESKASKAEKSEKPSEKAKDKA